MSKAKVFFIPVADNELLDSIAAKTARLAKAARLESVIPKGRPCAVKLHFGEDKNTGYVKPPIIRALVEFLRQAGGDPFLTDTNTLYRGRRSQATDHLNQAAEHGFTLDALGAPVIIADGLHGADQVTVPIQGGKHFKEVRIASALHQTAGAVVLTHVKGHCQAGLGGALKNVGMGCSARAGKLAQHDGGTPSFDARKCTGCGTCVRWCPTQAIDLAPRKNDKRGLARLTPEKCIGCGECLALCPFDAVGFEWAIGDLELGERVCEHCLGFVKNKAYGVAYLNFVIDVTRNCDCVGSRQKTERPNVGIIASTDLIAVDQATADLTREAYGHDVWLKWWPKSKYDQVLAYGETLGVGTRAYDLTRLD